MTAILDSFTITQSQLLGLFSVLGVALGLVALGGAAAGPRRLGEADLVHGLAAVVAGFTIFGALGVIGFSTLAAIAFVLAGAAAIYLVVRERRFGPPGGWRIVILALPLLVLSAAMLPTQWDELTQWLPNARFLIEHDGFPNPGLPRSPSVFPAYPYAVPLIVFLTSRIAGFMVENAPAMFNFLLYISFGLLVFRIMATMMRAEDTGPEFSGARLVRLPMGWGICASAALMVTILSPTYVSRLVMSAYADAPTTITVGFAAVAAWMMLNALAADDDAAAGSYAWQTGLAMTAAVGLKQVNLVFLLFLIGAAAVITLRDPAISWRKLAWRIPAMAALPVIVVLVWRYYVGENIPHGEFRVRDFDQWNIAAIPDLIARMALVASKKGGYFGLMTVATVLALRVVWRPRGAFDRLIVITAAMFVGYNIFLFVAYIAAFSKLDALRAGSYWRYNTHLGGVCLVFAVCGMVYLWRRWKWRTPPQFVYTLAIVLVLALPVAMAGKLRFDKHPRYDYARATAQAIAERLTPEDRILMIDLLDDGQYLVIMRYALYGSAAIVGEIRSWSNPNVDMLRKRIGRKSVSHIWVYEARPEVTAALDMALKGGASYLLKRSPPGWSVIATWPHPDR